MVLAFNFKETSKRILDRDKEVKATPPLDTLPEADTGLRSRWGGSPGVPQPPKKHPPSMTWWRERERERGPKGYYNGFIQRVPFLDATTTGKRVNPSLFLRQPKTGWTVLMWMKDVPTIQYMLFCVTQTIVTAVRDKLRSFTTSNSKHALTLCLSRCAHRWMVELRLEVVVKFSLSANTADRSRQSCDMSLC